MSIQVKEGEVLWVEKYRPTTIEDCILPKAIKKVFEGMRDNGVVENMLLHGTAGVGKTTIAKALCDEVGSSWKIINASAERNIDTVRTTIKQFASTSSFSGKRKVIVLDEADYMNRDSAQPALRNYIEEFSKTCSFVLTCNYPNKIIEPLRSRFANIQFNIPNDELPKLCSQFMERVERILKNENVEYDKAVIAKLIMRYFPDNRRILNELQRYSKLGKIDVGILSSFDKKDLSFVYSALKEKRFNDILTWVKNNSDLELASFYGELDDFFKDKMSLQQYAEYLLILEDHNRYALSVANPEIHLKSIFVNMMQLEYK